MGRGEELTGLERTFGHLVVELEVGLGRLRVGMGEVAVERKYAGWDLLGLDDMMVLVASFLEDVDARLESE